MATIRHFLANAVSVPLSLLRLSVKKVFYPKNLTFSFIERFSPNVIIDMDRKSKILFGEKVSIHSGGRFSAQSGGILSIGNRSSFNVGCIVTCHNRIQIGNAVSMGPHTMIFDHNHIMGKDGVYGTGFQVAEVVIGDNTWIGAGTIILAGTHIGKNCVIAAGSIVTGTVPDDTVLIQKREITYKRIDRSSNGSKSFDHYSSI